MTATHERLAFRHDSGATVRSRATRASTSSPEAAGRQAPAPVHRDAWDWAWGGLFIFTVLLFFRPQDQIALVGRLHVSDAAALLSLGALVALNVSRKRPAVRLTPEVIAVFVFGAAILLTVPTSIWPGGSVKVFTEIYIKVALIFLLLVNTLTSPKRIERVCWIIVLAFGLVSLRTWFDYSRGMHLVEGDRVSGAAGGFFENPNDLALNLVTFLPLALTFVLRPGPILKRAAAGAIALLMLGALVFTKSRSGMVGLAVMIPAYLFVSRSLRPAALIALLVAGLAVMPLLPQSFWHRMASITDESKDVTGSRLERLDLMQQAWQAFTERPFTGVGAGQFQNYSPPERSRKWRVTHNTPLQVAAEVGIIGLLAFGFFLWRGFAAAWNIRRRLRFIYRGGSRRRTANEPADGLRPEERHFLETHASAMLCCLVGWLVCSLFASVAYDWTIYYVVGLTVAARELMRQRAAGREQAGGHRRAETVAA